MRSDTGWSSRIDLTCFREQLDVRAILTIFEKYDAVHHAFVFLDQCNLEQFETDLFRKYINAGVNSDNTLRVLQRLSNTEPALADPEISLLLIKLAVEEQQYNLIEKFGLSAEVDPRLILNIIRIIPSPSIVKLICFRQDVGNLLERDYLEYLFFNRLFDELGKYENSDAVINLMVDLEANPTDLQRVTTALKAKNKAASIPQERVNTYLQVALLLRDQRGEQYILCAIGNRLFGMLCRFLLETNDVDLWKFAFQHAPTELLDKLANNNILAFYPVENVTTAVKALLGNSSSPTILVSFLDSLIRNQAFPHRENK